MSANTFIMKPKVDFCFKALMGYREVRLGLCAALLKVRPEEIEETYLLPTILDKNFADDKIGILDVRVLLKSGVQIDMEIQVKLFELWRERSLFYWSKMFISQIHEGEDYGALNKCIHVGILDFELFPEDQEYYSCFHLWEDNRHKMYSDKIEMHILELPKLAMYEHPQTELLRWARFLNAEKKEELEMIAKEDEYISKAYERLVNMSADEKKRMEYEAREKAIRDHNWLMKTNLQRGIERGMERGMEQGMEKAEQRYSCLVKLMNEDKRLELLAKAAEDPELLHKLYEEYGL